MFPLLPTFCTSTTPTSDRSPLVQMQEEDVEPEVLDVVCRVCEDCWASDRLEEHNELCTVLQQVKGGCSRCTVLCTVMQVYDVL